MGRVIRLCLNSFTAFRYQMKTSPGRRFMRIHGGTRTATNKLCIRSTKYAILLNMHGDLFLLPFLFPLNTPQPFPLALPAPRVLLVKGWTGFLFGLRIAGIHCCWIPTTKQQRRSPCKLNFTKYKSETCQKNFLLFSRFEIFRF
jgi:hypothetical protein